LSAVVIALICSHATVAVQRGFQIWAKIVVDVFDCHVDRMFAGFTLSVV
jgi:hypothetical protein